MFDDLNIAYILGNLTKDPELRYTNSGKPVLSFTVATNRSWKDSNDEWQEVTEYHSVTVWNRPESLADRLQKGTRVMVTGRIQTDKYSDKDGNDRYSTKIVADRVRLLARYIKVEKEESYFDQKDEEVTEQVEEQVEEQTEDEIDSLDLPF